jgi:acyl carrier protein
MPKTYEQVVDLIIDRLDVQPGDVTPQTAFVDLEADSLDRIELMMAAEEAFDVAIDDPEAEAVKTVADMVALVNRKLAAQERTRAV